MGVAGALLPLLPAFPFLALAAFSFSRASDRLHRWFLGTGLYRDYVAGFTSGRGMKRKAKVRAMTAVTAAMGAGFLLLRHTPWAQAVLAVIWVGHVLLFLFGIRTLPDKTE
jgi:uncharacterized membrane protein YbaN (DUF454 family)